MNNAESLKFFTGELVLLIGAFAVLFSDFWFKNKKWIGWSALLVVVLSAFFMRRTEGSADLFYGFFRLDSLSGLFRYAALGVTGLSILMSLPFRSLKKDYLGEYYALLLFIGFGLILMAGARNLLMIFLSIEFVSIVSYLLTGFLKDDPKSKEASLKYLLFGSACSALMLYGMSFLYGLTNSLDLAVIRESIVSSPSPALVNAAFLLVLAGLGFKISMAPFHMWAPDVYEGAPTPVTAFLTVGPKALGFAVMIRVLTEAFPAFVPYWAQILLVLSIITMTAGNVTAVAQTNLKRLLAYSSIAQAGYILMGLAVFTSTGLEAVLFYIAAYIFTNAGAFIVVLAAGETHKSYELEALAGLSKRSPVLAASLTLFLLSLAGIPPLAGFVAKFYVFAGAVEKGYFMLAITAAVNSVIAAFYYFKMVRMMYLVPGENTSPAECSFPLKLALGITLIGTIGAGLFPAPVIALVREAIGLS